MAVDTTRGPNAEIYAESRETRDVRGSSLAKYAIALAVGVAISMVLMSVLQRFLTNRIHESSPPPAFTIRPEDRLPPLPRQFAAPGNRFKPEHFTQDPALQRQLAEENLNFELLPPERYREVYDWVKRQELHSYGAIADQPGAVHIPIEMAERQLVERGGAAPAAQQSGRAGAAGAAGAATSNRSGSGVFEWDSPPTAASAGRMPERRTK